MMRWPQVGILIAGIAVIAGSFLDWVRAPGALELTLREKGIATFNGRLVLVLGVALLLIGLASLSMRSRLPDGAIAAAWATGLLGLSVVVVTIRYAGVLRATRTSLSRPIEGLEAVEVHSGLGLWVSCVGGVMVAVLSALYLLQLKRSSGPVSRGSIDPAARMGATTKTP